MPRPVEGPKYVSVNRDALRTVLTWVGVGLLGGLIGLAVSNSDARFPALEMPARAVPSPAITRVPVDVAFPIMTPLRQDQITPTIPTQYDANGNPIRPGNG